jgi:hypothetical protein
MVEAQNWKMWLTVCKITGINVEVRVREEKLSIKEFIVGLKPFNPSHLFLHSVATNVIY